MNWWAVHFTENVSLDDPITNLPANGKGLLEQFERLFLIPEFVMDSANNIQSISLDLETEKPLLLACLLDSSFR
jgi:hypothetical protein